MNVENFNMKDMWERILLTVGMGLFPLAMYYGPRVLFLAMFVYEPSDPYLRYRTITGADDKIMMFLILSPIFLRFYLGWVQWSGGTARRIEFSGIGNATEHLFRVKGAVRVHTYAIAAGYLFLIALVETMIKSIAAFSDEPTPPWIWSWALALLAVIIAVIFKSRARARTVVTRAVRELHDVLADEMKIDDKQAQTLSRLLSTKIETGLTFGTSLMVDYNIETIIDGFSQDPGSVKWLEAQEVAIAFCDQLRHYVDESI